MAFLSTRAPLPAVPLDPRNVVKERRDVPPKENQVITSQHSVITGAKALKIPTSVSLSLASLSQSIDEHVPCATSDPSIEGSSVTSDPASISQYGDENEPLYSRHSQVQIPVSAMTVKQVKEVLRLLNLDRHVDSFVSQDIDGDMLCSLTEDILINDFGFKPFDAKKLMKFSKGWRAKQS